MCNLYSCELIDRNTGERIFEVSEMGGRIATLLTKSDDGIDE